jgi:hypothetical protein
MGDMNHPLDLGQRKKVILDSSSILAGHEKFPA